MSYGMTLYLVPRDVLDIYGSNDQELLEEVLEARAPHLARYDRELHAPNPEDEADLSHADALREIFAGQFTPDVRGSRYGWALETLFGSLGEDLDNGPFMPCNMAWYTLLDEVLEAHNVPLRFSDLTYRLPVPIPESDDWPCIGYWDEADFAAADALAACLPKLEDRQIREALETALGWIRAARREPDLLIVGFHG